MNEQSLRSDPLVKLGFIFGISVLICCYTPGYVKMVTGLIAIVSGLLAGVIVYVRVKTMFFSP